MKHIAFYSGGKDSTATVILAHEHGEPLDEIVFVEVMFDEEISGELPEHINFVKTVAFPLFESWGYKTTIIHSEKTYMDCFFHICVKGKHIGKKKGFVMTGHCDVQRDCKIKAINEYKKRLGGEIIQYIGYAADENVRLQRLKDTDVSLLEKYKYSEEKAFELCKQYNLLSPSYEFTNRGGVGFARTQKTKS